MAGVEEALVQPDGPPIYEQRQITPAQFNTLRYLCDISIPVELVHVDTGRVESITIDDVTLTYLFGETPNSSRPVLPEEKAGWRVEPPSVTFYHTVEGENGRTYKYDHIPAKRLGLAPQTSEAGSQERWPHDLLLYLRWSGFTIEEIPKEAA